MLDASRLGAVTSQIVGLLDAAFDGVAVYRERRIAQASTTLVELLGRDPVGERLLAHGTGLRSPAPGWDLHWIGAMQASNGELVRVEVYGVDCTWEDQPAYLMAVRRLQDTDERPDERPDEVNEVNEVNEVVRQRAQAMFNHINNELGAMLGNLELALERALGPDERTLVADAWTAARRATDLFVQLQLLSGDAHMIREVQELDAVLRRVVPQDCHLDLSLGRLRVDVDASRLTDVLATLHANSVAAGASSIRVSTRLSGERACIEHTDDARATNADDPARNVTLQTVRRIVDGHGGTLEFSTSDSGTRVRIFLPVVSTPPVPAIGRRDILVLDDEANIRALCRRALEDNGHRVHLASSGAEALEILEQVDVVLMDISMPDMNGVEFAKAARARRPSIPLLAMTGYADVTARDMLDAMGIRVLAKPWRLKTLMDEVERALSPVD